MNAAHAQLADWLREDAFRWRCLQVVRDTLGNDAWLAAGFVRNLVWDRQHGHARPTPLADVDVIYLDHARPETTHEQAREARLHRQLATNWQVRNQARMAARQQHAPYRSCAEAIACWPETATCYAVRLDDDSRLHWLAPLGWAPLFAASVVRNPRFGGGDAQWQRRLQQKNWQQNWPRLHIQP